MEYEFNEQFTIKDDNAADWAVRTIKAEEEELDRMRKIAEAQIIEINEKLTELGKRYENKTGFLKSKLIQYFNTVPHKETKTQESYKLLSGSLVYKKPSIKITHNDDDKLIEYLENNDGKDYIKVKKSVDWAEFKKNLIISDDGEIVDSELGTIIDKEMCSIEEVPASFNIKF